jgi:hypothetical protein
LGGDWARYREYGDEATAPLLFDLVDEGRKVLLTARRTATLVVETPTNAVAVRFYDLDLSTVVP